jgi:hypothetical protein
MRAMPSNTRTDSWRPGKRTASALKKERKMRQTVWYFGLSEGPWVRVKHWSLFVLYAIGGFLFFTIANDRAKDIAQRAGRLTRRSGTE